MPNDPDELDEIKSLLENSVTNVQPASSDQGSLEQDSFEQDSLEQDSARSDDADPEQADIAALEVWEKSGKDALIDIDLLPAVETPVRPVSIAASPKKPGAGRSGPPAIQQKNAVSRPFHPDAAHQPAADRPALPAVPQKSGVSNLRFPITKKKPGMEITYSESELSAASLNEDTALSGDESLIIPYEPPPRNKTSGRPDPEVDTGSDKFKMKFDFDDEYIDVPERKPIMRRREKRTGCIGGILYAAFVISISLVLASLLWMAAVDVLGFGADDEQINVTVQQGFKIEDVTEMLYDAGLIRYKFLFNLYAAYSSAEDKITAGSYILNMNYDYRSLVQGMTARVGKRVEITVPIPEGFTLAQIFARLEDYGVCPADDLWETAKTYDFKYSFLDSSSRGNRLRLEGFLFPETYNFYKDSTPAQAITIFLREFNKRFTEQLTERAEFMGYSVHDIITIASMIEREAGDDEERSRIAAVIYNRLNSDDFPHLQIDATIHYAIAGTGRTFSTDIDSPYNTYIREGLPPGPISNPGMASIRAALYPETTDEYYYALNKSGTHNFFRTLAQQEAFVQSDEYGG